MLLGHPDHAWTKLLTLNLQRVFTLTQLLTPLLTRGAAIAKDPQALASGRSDPARVIVSVLPSPSFFSLLVPFCEAFLRYHAFRAGACGGLDAFGGVSP